MELGGVLQPVTVLFADIRGFTPLSEQMDAREVVDLLNDFFAVMTAAIFQSNGTLDKFIGDCVMALFGAPIPSDRSPRNALVAAVRMQQQVARLGAERVRARPGAHADRHRTASWPGRRRQHRIGGAHAIHRHRRHGEHRGPAGQPRGARPDSDFGNHAYRGRRRRSVP